MPRRLHPLLPPLAERITDWDEMRRRAVAAAPPLTPEQAAVIRRLVLPVSRPATAEADTPTTEKEGAA